MPLQTFVPVVAPSPGTTFEPEIKITEARFGDGYTLAAPSGLNHIREVIELNWAGLTLGQLSQIRQFFLDHGGVRPFLYQPRSFSAVLKWTCAKWSYSDTSPFTFRATLRQSFTLET